MITKICLDNINCYKNATSLQTDKKINLIYGLNGSGKSTLSDFLYNQSESEEKSIYGDCSISGRSSEDVLVYNQTFINNYFYESHVLKGIFTLSKENKEAKEKIENLQKDVSALELEKKQKTDDIVLYNQMLLDKKKSAEDVVWEIKTKYAGGDRVLEYCLTGLMGRKETLYGYLSKISKKSEQPAKTIQQLKNELDSIKGSSAIKYSLLPMIQFSFSSVEVNPLFRKVIVGNENSAVAELIRKLKNSDWVGEGLRYIADDISKDGDLCPFCQEKTITEQLIKEIKSYFDKTYEDHMQKLNESLVSYDSAIRALPQKTIYESNPFIVEKRDKFEKLFKDVLATLSSNKEEIENKIEKPSHTISLKESNVLIKQFNEFIETVNYQIEEHNTKLDNKDKLFSEIKEQFWSIMRWHYDPVISGYLKEKESVDLKVKCLNDEVKYIDDNIVAKKNIINETQKETINVQEAVDNINNGLEELGIDSFSIKPYQDDLYQIVRPEQIDNVFHTLSEGEKMIVSFLYFIELCKGKKTASSSANKKIVVIDDPISSLSHIYIYNVGRLIKNEFLNSNNYEQIFVLTHSLYFFYELTDTNHERRAETQKLFRMIKNKNSTQILEMKYEEIQNHYHSYWYIIKDDSSSSALIANCMRNIIEYFFNFVEKKDLNNVFQKPNLQKNKYQAFCRYINRESHSLGQNIFDFKEFDYEIFKEAFKLVFVECGYEEHYNKMMK